jgi:hypothetical protein
MAVWFPEHICKFSGLNICQTAALPLYEQWGTPAAQVIMLYHSSMMTSHRMPRIR